jgi:hypothetical protein
MSDAAADLIIACAEIAQLKNENDKLRRQVQELAEDFTDFVTEHTDDAAPYCANKLSICTDRRGRCLYNDFCSGFLPAAARRLGK